MKKIETNYLNDGKIYTFIDYATFRNIPNVKSSDLRMLCLGKSSSLSYVNQLVMIPNKQFYHMAYIQVPDTPIIVALEQGTFITDGDKIHLTNFKTPIFVEPLIKIEADPFAKRRDIRSRLIKILGEKNL